MPSLARKPARGNWIWLGGALCAVVVLAGVAVARHDRRARGRGTRSGAGTGRQRGAAAAGAGQARLAAGPARHRRPGRRQLPGRYAAVAVFYDPGDAVGSCSLGPFPPGGRYVSLPPERFGHSAACGSYVTVQGPRGQVRAEVVDLCPGAPPT